MDTVAMPDKIDPVVSWADLVDDILRENFEAQYRVHPSAFRFDARDAGSPRETYDPARRELPGRARI